MCCRSCAIMPHVAADAAKRSQSRRGVACADRIVLRRRISQRDTATARIAEYARCACRGDARCAHCGGCVARINGKCALRASRNMRVGHVEEMRVAHIAEDARCAHRGGCAQCTFGGRALRTSSKMCPACIAGWALRTSRGMRTSYIAADVRCAHRGEQLNCSRGRRWFIPRNARRPGGRASARQMPWRPSASRVPPWRTRPCRRYRDAPMACH